MITKIYWINEQEIGDNLLGTMPRPRGNDWLEDEIKSLKTQEVDCLVSLLDSDEIVELGLEDEKNLCVQNGIEFINFPIVDITVPKNEEAYLKLVNQLTSYINDSKKVVIHCRMGIGRSTILAGGVLIKKGINANAVFDIIGKHRTLQVPDTEEQKKWVWGMADRILKRH